MDDSMESKIPQVSVDEVKNSIDRKEKCILLDVRTAGEYARGKIEGSINLPLEKVESEILKVIPDKSAKIYVYCLSGSRSVFAVDVMVKLGYTNVFDVAHGLLAWRVKSYPVVASETGGKS